MSKSLPSFLAALSLAAAAVLPSVGHAAPVQRSFTLITDFGPATGPFSGSFVYDDAQAPTLSPFGDQLYTLSAFTLGIDGQVFALADLDEAFAVFDGSSFLGLAATLDGVLTLTPAFDPLGAFFAYSSPAGETVGSIVYAAVNNTVPEPGVILLLSLGLAALGASRRRT